MGEFMRESGRDPGYGRVVRNQDWHEEAFGVRAVKQFHRQLSAMQTANSAATLGHASNDNCSADIGSLDNLRIKSLRPSTIRWRMNDT
jgi:hypothetical protein